MTRLEELTNPNSCFNKADATELLFVLLEHDVAAPTTVRYWCTQRVKMGKNTWNDPQITEAMEWANTAEKNNARN
jgi:hypothetical protein